MFTTVRIMPKININKYKIKNSLSVWLNSNKSFVFSSGIDNSSNTLSSLPFFSLSNPFFSF